MPNWTENHISVKNPEVIRACINEEGHFDFNLLIPMPEDLVKTEASSEVKPAMAYYLVKKRQESGTE